MDYSKERLKMGALLVVGFVLAISFFSLQSSLNIGGRYSDSFSSGFIFVAIVCYPLAIIYGKHQIMDVFNSISFGDRQPFHNKRKRAGSESLISVFPYPALSAAHLICRPQQNEIISSDYATKMTSARRPCWVLPFFVFLANSKRATCPG